MDSVRYEDSPRNNGTFLGIYQGPKALKADSRVDGNVPAATNTRLSFQENKQLVALVQK